MLTNSVRIRAEKLSTAPEIVLHTHKMFVGPLEARKMAFVVGYKKWLKRSQGVADFQAFLKPYFSTFMAMFKLA